MSVSDAPPVRVVGDDRLAGVVERAGGTVVGDDASEIALTVAAGESAVARLVESGATGPLLAIDAGRGVRSVPATDREAGIAAGIEAVRERDLATVERRPLSIDVEDGPATLALFDATLVTAEPARISEYTVETDGTGVGRVRADGIVVATPAGSHGYARAAGGPTVAPDTDSVAVVPISPFATDASHWALAGDDLTLSPVRDEGEVTLLADDREVDTIAPETSVRIGRTRAVRFAVVPQSQSFFGRS